MSRKPPPAFRRGDPIEPNDLVLGGGARGDRDRRRREIQQSSEKAADGVVGLTALGRSLDGQFDAAGVSPYQSLLAGLGLDPYTKEAPSRAGKDLEWGESGHATILPVRDRG